MSEMTSLGAHSSDDPRKQVNFVTSYLMMQISAFIFLQKKINGKTCIDSFIGLLR
jgi:hypothetical protein